MKYILGKPNKQKIAILIIKHSNIKITSNIRVKYTDFNYHSQSVARNESLTHKLDLIRERLNDYIYNNRPLTKEKLKRGYELVREEVEKEEPLEERPTLYQGIAAFLTLRHTTLSESYSYRVGKYLERFKPFLEIFYEGIEGDQVAAMLISKLRGEGKSNGTINDIIGTLLKPYFKSVGSPIQLRRLPYSPPEPRFLTDKEVSDLFERRAEFSGAPKLALDSFLLCYYSGGLRVSELKELRRVKPNDISITINQPKVNKPRRLKLHNRVHEILKDHNYNLEIKTATRLDVLLKKIDKGLASHVARRSFLNWAYRVKGMDLVTLQKISGHKTLNNLRGYLRISDDEVDEAFNSLW